MTPMQIDLTSNAFRHYLDRDVPRRPEARQASRQTFDQPRRLSRRRRRADPPERLERPVHALDLVQRGFQIMRLRRQQQRNHVRAAFRAEQMRHVAAILVGEVVIVAGRSRAGRRRRAAATPTRSRCGPCRSCNEAAADSSRASAAKSSARRYSSTWSTPNMRYCAITRRSSSAVAIAPALTCAQHLQRARREEAESRARGSTRPRGRRFGFDWRSNSVRKSIRPAKAQRIEPGEIVRRQIGETVGAKEPPPARSPPVAAA